MPFDPNSAKPFDASPAGARAAFDPISAKPIEQNTSLLQDLGTDVKRGVQQLPGIATGLADIPVSLITGERRVSRAADILADATGFTPGKWAEEAEAEYSPQRQASDAEVDKAREEGGFWNVAGSYAQNPRSALGIVAESAPSMVTGSLAGRAALGIGRATGLLSKPATAAQAGRQAVAAGAGGEGSVIAGSTMDEIDDSVDARRAAVASLGAGAVGTALGYGGAKVAQRFGVFDPETLIAGGTAGASRPSPGLVKRMLGGAMTEGVFEELPQSAQETMWQNWAEGRPIMEGVPEAAAAGMVAGGVMGAGANVLGRGAQQQSAPATDAGGQDQIAGLLPSPVSTGTPNEQVLQAEVERANAVAAADARGAEIQRQRAEYEAARMGIDRNAGPLSAAAVASLETGAAQQQAEIQAMQVQAEQQDEGQQDAQQPEVVDVAEAMPAQDQSRRLMPFNEQGAQRIADRWTQERGEAYAVVPHPTVAGRFAVVPAAQAGGDQAADIAPVESMEDAPVQAVDGGGRGDLSAAPTDTPRRLDPGELSIPGRLNGINADLDRFNREQRSAQKAASKTEAAQRRQDKAEAKGLHATYAKDMVARFGDQFGAADLGRELRRMSTWEPRRFIDLVSQFRSETEGAAASQAGQSAEEPAAALNAPPAEGVQTEDASDGRATDTGSNAAVAAPSSAQAGSNVERGADDVAQQPDVPSAPSVQPVAGELAPGDQPVVAAGGEDGGAAVAQSAEGGTALDRAIPILMANTAGNGSPDGLTGPENADARTQIVSALTGESVADIEAAPNYKFRTSVPQVERLLYDAAGIPAGKLPARREKFLDLIDAREGRGPVTLEIEMPGDEMFRRMSGVEAGESLTAADLKASVADSVPGLEKHIDALLERGRRGEKGGVVIVDGTDAATIEREYRRVTGRPLSATLRVVAESRSQTPLAFYQPQTGVTFLIGPMLNRDTAASVLLHEVYHSQQSERIDAAALRMIEGRANAPARERALLDRVAARMESVGEAGNRSEAAAYIIEEAVRAGQIAGFTSADSKLADWIDANISKRIGNLVRAFIMNVRAWATRHGIVLGRLTVDDLVGYAMAGMERAARGDVQTAGRARASAQAEDGGEQFSRASRQGPLSFAGSTASAISERADRLYQQATGQQRPDPADPFAAENARLREQDQTLWAKGKKQLRRYLTPGGLLPQAVFDQKIERDSNFQAVEFDVRHIVGGFEQAVKKDFGKAFDKLTAAEQRMLSNALAGAVPAGLKEDTKAAVVAMRQYIDTLSGEYLNILQSRIDALMLRAQESNRDGDRAAAISEIELYEKIRGNIGAYVHRSYQAFDDPNWFKKVPAVTLNAARKYLADGYMEDRKVGEQEAYRRAEVVLNEILKNGTAYDSMESFVAEGKLGAKDLSVLMRRKDVPPVIRALLGEYTDPRLNFTKSATKMGRLIWNQRFLDRVREIGMGTFLFEGKDRPPSATSQIAADGSDAYAPLNGLWTFPEVTQAFKDALGKDQMSDLYRFIIRANGMVKYGKTVLSPTTAMRNWQSAMFFTLANGHFDLTQMKKSVSAFREQVRQSATGDDLAYLRHLKELGVVYDTPYAGEMMRYIEDARADDGVETVMRAFGASEGAVQKGLRGVKQLNQIAQGFYTFGDDFWKIIGFENEKAGLLAAGMSAQEAEREAAKRIRNTYPTYSMVGSGIRWLSRFPLMGTFVSFPAEIIRNSGNMLRITASDLKSDNPAIRRLGMRRAVGMAMVSGMFYGLAALSKAMLGVDDDEEEALRDLAPPWQKNSTFLFAGRDDKGNLRYFDLSFLDPYGYWKRPLTAMMRDQPWEDSALSAVKDMLDPFFGTDIATGAIFEVLANKKGSGGQVFSENADVSDQAADITNHLRKALQPGFAGNVERLTMAMQGIRRQGSGQPYNLQDEMVALLGWRSSTMDPKTALYYRSFEFNDAMSEARQGLNRVLRSANKVSTEDIADAKGVARSRQIEAFTEMRRLVEAARAAGMNPIQIRQVLGQSSISQANIQALMRGTPPPFQVTPQAMTKAVRQAQAMEGPEFAREIARRFKEAAAVKVE